MSATVLILANEPTLAATHPDADSEHDILYTADGVARHLQQAGLTVRRLGLTGDVGPLLSALRELKPDVVFNLYEGLAGWGDTEAFVAGVLELAGVPCTGSPTQPLLLCRSKPLTKRLLSGAGLPTAAFLVIDGEHIPEWSGAFPVIVKPALEDASVGIDQASVVETQDQLAARVREIQARYGPQVLVEQFVRGREFNVALVEVGGELTALPFSEIHFVPPADKPGLWPIVSFDAKWRPGTVDFAATPAQNPAVVEPTLAAEIERVAKDAFRLVGCRDYARVDFRVDESGQPFVLEVNPNPCISPLAGLAAGLESARIPYGEFILERVRGALRRAGRTLELGESETPAAVPGATKPRARVGPARAAERRSLADAFGAAEDCRPFAAALGAAPKRSAPDWLRPHAARLGSGPAGFVQLAHAEPGVVAVAALAVLPAARRLGVARALLERARDLAQSAGARWLVAHTTNSPADAPARALFRGLGWRPAGDWPEFTRDGTARLSFALPVPAGQTPDAPPGGGVAVALPPAPAAV